MKTIEVQRLPVDTGRSGWEAISRRATAPERLVRDISTDWLIVGAGFAGLSAARRLRQVRPGDRIVVVDAKELAWGPAGRNSGYMIDVPHSLSSGEYSASGASATAREIEQNRFAIAFAKSAAEEYGMQREVFDPCGKINAAASARGLTLNERYAASLRGIGEKNESLDARQMKEITGSNYYLGGLYTPGAVLIQPADYIRRFAAGLGSAVSIYENTPVLGLSRSGRQWIAKTPDGQIAANKVILGVNGHIQDFGHYRGRLMHIFTYASMTAGFRDRDFKNGATGQDRWALLPADPMGATVRKITQEGVSRIVIRTRFTYDPSLQVSDERVARIAATQKISFDARFPELSALPMEYRWAGRLCLSLNSVPAFGEIEEDLYSACCENGLGTVKSTLAGVMAVDLATGNTSPMLAGFRNQPAPKRIPPEPFAWLGINSVIRLQELRARRES